MYDSSIAPPPPPPLPGEQKHSKLGIASFVLAIIALMVVCGDVALAVAMSGGLNVSQNYAPVDTALTCAAALIALVGVGLGIAAVVQKNTKKLFGILGLVFSGLIVLGICGLMGVNLLTLAGR